MQENGGRPAAGVWSVSQAGRLRADGQDDEARVARIQQRTLAGLARRPPLRVDGLAPVGRSAHSRLGKLRCGDCDPARSVGLRLACTDMKCVSKRLGIIVGVSQLRQSGHTGKAAVAPGPVDELVEADRVFALLDELDKRLWLVVDLIAQGPSIRQRLAGLRLDQHARFLERLAQRTDLERPQLALIVRRRRRDAVPRRRAVCSIDDASWKDEGIVERARRFRSRSRHVDTHPLAFMVLRTSRTRYWSLRGTGPIRIRLAARRGTAGPSAELEDRPRMMRQALAAERERGLAPERMPASDRSSAGEVRSVDSFRAPKSMP